MNVLENYLEKTKKIILKKIKELNISENYNFESVNIEVPPTNFDFDLSCNIAMVLGKQIKENPKNLAEKIKKILLKECKDFDSVQVAGPGFINMRLNNSALQNIIIGIYKDKNSYGSNKKNKKYNVS